MTEHRRSLGTDLAGVLIALGYGTTGVSVGQPLLGLAGWYRDGTLAESVAIETRELAPLPGEVDLTVGASLPVSGLTGWQGLFDHDPRSGGAERPRARDGRRSRVDSDAARA